MALVVVVIIVVFAKPPPFNFVLFFTVVDIVIGFDGSGAGAHGSARDTSILEPSVGTFWSVANKGNALLQHQGKGKALQVASARRMDSPFALNALSKGSVDTGLVAPLAGISGPDRGKLGVELLSLQRILFDKRASVSRGSVAVVVSFMSYCNQWRSPDWGHDGKDGGGNECGGGKLEHGQRKYRC